MSPGAQVGNSPIGHRTKSLSNPGSLSASARKELKSAHRSNKSLDSAEDPGLLSESGSFFVDDGSVHIPPTARVREKKLRADPMVTVLSPLYVSCNLCQTRIKLSTKSMFDLCHWRTHRARCLKRRPKGLVLIENTSSGKVREASEEPNESPLSSPSLSPRPTSAKVKASSTRNAAADSSDDVQSPRSDDVYDDATNLQMNDREYSEEPVDSLSAAKGTVAPSPPSASELAFEAYMLKSKRETKQRPLENWKDWSWSQLIVPQFEYSLPPQTEGDAQDLDYEDQPLSEPVLNAVAF